MKNLRLKTENGYLFDIDWEILEKSIATLQKLAPSELRANPEDLDDLYEIKRLFKEAVQFEEEIGAEADDLQILQDDFESPTEDGDVY